MSRVRILFEYGLHGGAQAGEAAAHVGDAGRDPDARARRKRDHRLSCSRTIRRFSGSTDPSTRMRAGPSSMWMAPETTGAMAGRSARGYSGREFSEIRTGSNSVA